MSGAVKGGLFVGAAAAVGLLVGFLVPPLVVAERETAKRPRADASPRPAMPYVVGRPLDEAERELRRRGIAYVTDGEEVLGVVVPSLWEVCETEPAAGQKLRGAAHLRAALPGTCVI